MMTSLSEETSAYKFAEALGNQAIATIEKATTIMQIDDWLAKNATVLGRLPPDIMQIVRYAASQKRIKLGAGAPLTAPSA